MCLAFGYLILKQTRKARLFPQTAPLDNSELDLLLVEPASTRMAGERAGFPPGTTPKLKSVIVYGENNNKAWKVNKG